MPFAALGLGCCLLMARIAPDPRGAALTRSAAGRARRRPRPRRAHAQRGGLAGAVWVVVAWTTVARPARRPPPHDRRRRPSSPWPSSRRGRYATGCVLGSPLPGQAVTNAFSCHGFDIFAWNDPPTLARGTSRSDRPAARHADRRARAQPWQRPAVSQAFPISFIGLVALPWQARGRTLRPLAAGSPDHVPRHEPRVPGRDHVGHLPARGRPVPRAARDQRPARARRRSGAARVAHELDTPRSPGSGRSLGIFSSRPVLRRAPADIRKRLAGHGSDCTRSWVRGWRRSSGRSTTRWVR